jgi:hypothetical protein
MQFALMSPRQQLVSIMPMWSLKELPQDTRFCCYKMIDFDDQKQFTECL